MGSINTKTTENKTKKPLAHNTSTGYDSQQISELSAVVPLPEPVELNYPVFVGKYDYDSRTDNDLCFKKGQYTIQLVRTMISMVASYIYRLKNLAHSVCGNY